MSASSTGQAATPGGGSLCSMASSRASRCRRAVAIISAGAGARVRACLAGGGWGRRLAHYCVAAGLVGVQRICVYWIGGGLDERVQSEAERKRKARAKHRPQQNPTREWDVGCRMTPFVWRFDDWHWMDAGFGLA